MDEDELKKIMEQNDEGSSNDIAEPKKLSNVTEKEVTPEKSKENETQSNNSDSEVQDNKDKPEQEQNNREVNESEQQTEYVPSFDELVEADYLIPIPLYLNDDVRNSVNKVHNAQSYLARNREGDMNRRFPKQDIYSGRVTEISNRPIKFPKRTGYGEDRYVVVELDNGLCVYVPSRQAGLTQPSALNLMRDQLKSVIITDIYDKSNISENGNDNVLYAIGTIQSAEYQIGAALRSEFVNDPENFLNYNRSGIISGIDRLHQEAIVTIDLTDQGSGYIDTKIPLDDLIKHFSFETITDFPEFEVGSPINFNFTNIFEREIENSDKHIKGIYYDIECSREKLPDFRAKKYKARVKTAIALQDEIPARLRGITARAGVLIELEPGEVYKANTNHRGINRINFTRDDIRDHAIVYVRIDPRIHSYEELKHGKVSRPIIITKIRHSRRKLTRQIAKNKGSYRGVSQQQYEAVANKYSISNGSKNNNQRLKKIHNEVRKMIEKDK